MPLKPDIMKKPTLKKRLKCHDSTVAPPTNSLGISKMPDSPNYSETWGKRKVFVTVLKILFLVGVAIVTNRRVVSLSMSAFSLFFVEHVVKYLYKLYKYVFVSQTMKKTASFSSIEGDSSTGDGFLSDCSSLNASGEEMQDVQAEFDSDIRVAQEANYDHNKIVSFGDTDTSVRVLENDENCNAEGSSIKHRGHRREKVKSKIKKLVPKKIRRSMKRRSSIKREKSRGSLEEINFEVKGYINEVVDDEKEDTASESCQQMKSDSEESVVEANPQRPTDRRTLILDYCFISFIVLAGIFEGQSLVVGLTVAWCLIMKLQARIHMRK
ncbi:hypothetical protein POM88_049842 [Heracleum sosnowskyi]|uniref:Uncharacterized protein n=1 Tax=Heracleum sosnowskyi TaxID=360622 RepID=A0AAD8GXN4_9APIA|nr:hypothetical protein POM88_049842 [Heracleum sosnowskyi]